MRAGGWMDTEVDTVVVGTGPGGEEVAERLAEKGLSVVGIDSHLVGGECPYYGCVPSKMMVRGADLLAEARRVDGMAGRATVTPDFAPVGRRIRAEATDDWDDRAAVERFEKLGGTFVRGRGALDGPRRVRVGDRGITARRGVVLATGTSPVVPPIPGLADAPYWTNREAVQAERAPHSLVVLGGGAIGLEMAQAFRRFGSAVTVVEALEVDALLRRVLGDEGIDIRVGARAVRVTTHPDGVEVTLDDGSSVRGERLLVATGRRANLRDLGLTSLGLDGDARSVPVDDRMRAADGLWALGDITGVGAFTLVAVYQARIAIDDILGRDGPTADCTGLAWVTFTDPEVGRVGMSERQSREAGLAVRTGMAPVSASTRGWIHGPGNAGFIKLVADADRDVLVGATSVGPYGGEVLAMLVLAVHARLPVAALRTMISAYRPFTAGCLTRSRTSTAETTPDGS